MSNAIEVKTSNLFRNIWCPNQLVPPRIDHMRSTNCFLHQTTYKRHTKPKQFRESSQRILISE